MSLVSPRNDFSNIRSHPPMTLMTTMTIVVQSVTAISDTHAMRRRRRYLRMRVSLYMRLKSEDVKHQDTFTASTVYCSSSRRGRRARTPFAPEGRRLVATGGAAV